MLHRMQTLRMRVFWKPSVLNSKKGANGKVRSKITLKWTRLMRLEVVLFGAAMDPSATGAKTARGKGPPKGDKKNAYAHITSSLGLRAKLDKENSSRANSRPGSKPGSRAGSRPGSAYTSENEEEDFLVTKKRPLGEALKRTRAGGLPSARGPKPPAAAQKAEEQRQRAEELRQASEHWTMKQERGFVQWLNHVLCGGGEQKAEDASDLTLADLFDRRAGSQACESVLKLYRSEGTREVLHKLRGEIDAGRLAVKAGRDVTNDIESRRALVKLLLCYNPVWLCAALSAIHSYDRVQLRMDGQEDGLPPGLHGLGAQAKAAVLLKSFMFPKEEQALRAISEKAALRRGQVLTQKFLSLVYLLDRAKNSGLVPGDPCLFQRGSLHLSSASIVAAFSKEGLREGNAVRHLKLMGYELLHTQHELDAYKFKGVLPLDSNLFITECFNSRRHLPKWMDWARLCATECAWRDWQTCLTQGTLILVAHLTQDLKPCHPFICVSLTLIKGTSLVFSGSPA